MQWLHIKGSTQPLAGVARQLSWTCKFTGMPVGWPKGLFTLTSLTEKNDQGRWFVPAQNYAAITHRHDMLEHQRAEALVPSCNGGWCLVDKLPDTDELSGIPMSGITFASRWQLDPSLVLEHLLNTRGGIG